MAATKLRSALLTVCIAVALCHAQSSKGLCGLKSAFHSRNEFRAPFEAEPSLADDPPVSSKQLPITTKPAKGVPGLDNNHIVSVSEYRSKGAASATRVFRYSFRGTFASVVRNFKLKLAEKEGWKSSWIDAHECDFWREPAKGPIAMQGVLVFAARLRRDYKSPTGWSPMPPNLSRGWVSVSYNERLRPSGHK